MVQNEYPEPVTITHVGVELQRRAKAVGFDPRRDNCPLHPPNRRVRFRLDCTHSLLEVVEHLEQIGNDDGEGS